jgi:hypothetical protein
MKRWQIIVLAVLAIFGVAVIAGYRTGVKLLQSQIVEALGPGSRLTEIKVNWFSVELFGLSIDGPKGWPASRTLEAERVVVVPDLRSLLSDQIRISSIVVEKTLPIYAARSGQTRLGAKYDGIGPWSEELAFGRERCPYRHDLDHRIKRWNG